MPDKIQRGDMVRYKLPPIDQRSRYDLHLGLEHYLLVKWGMIDLNMVVNHGEGKLYDLDKDGKVAACLLLSVDGTLRWHETYRLEKVNASHTT